MCAGLRMQAIMRRCGSSFAARRNAALPLGARGAKRRLRRKRAREMWPSPRYRVARCSRSTATRLRTDPTMRCPKPFARATARARAVVVAWDTLEAPTKRRELFPAYQSGREFDDELIEQLNLLPQFVTACGFTNAKAAGFEADDFLAAAAAAEERAGGEVLVASGDRDAFQLASKMTTILYPERAGEVARIGPDEVRARYGVEPQRVPDFIALRGDPSDKIPGAAGVGPKRAAGLLRRFGTLDAVLDARLFASEAEALRLYRRIATMDVSAPLPPLPDQAPTWDKAAELARTWGLAQLAERLAGKA